MWSWAIRPGRKFQPTRPLRDATICRGLHSSIRSYFNPRVPCGTRRPASGCSRACPDFTPRVPCGTRRACGTRFSRPSRHFNPRVPCGTRQSLLLRFIHRLRFQPTRPLRDATGFSMSHRRRNRFQPTRPLRDATPFMGRLDITTCNFNPRVPYGTRRRAAPAPARRRGISTHASLAGRD